MHLDEYLGTTQQAQTALADAFRQVATAHGEEPDLAHLCEVLAAQSDTHAARLKPFAPTDADAPSHAFAGPRSGPLGLLRDLLDLYVLASACDIAWTIVGQAARGARNEELLAVVTASESETATQLKWLATRIKQAAPQTLVVS
jgi:hypothetical protein